MKALSIKQPWADLIIYGYKLIETRTWKTDYRGELLICSSKSVDREAMDYFKDLFPKDHKFLTGKALAVVTLKDCIKMIKEHEASALCDLYDGYSCIIENIKPIEPFDIKGQLGLFEVDYGNI